jgi:glutaminyl-tRNA synthetase
VLSKRKITKLIQDKVVEGWGDPRLMTMAGLRNRGYTPSVITSFIDRINIARAGNENITQNNILILELKKELFHTAERVMGVLEPVKLNLKNFK